MATGLRTIRQLAESYWSAEERRDIEAILAHYHDDAIYQDGGGRRSGIEAIRAFYRSSAEAYPGIRVTILADFPVEGESAVEFEALLTDREGRSWTIQGVNLFKAHNGRFTSVRSYEDAPRLLEE
jgi:ketosteroid isomerase-like protein